MNPTLAQFLLDRIAEDKARLYSRPWWPHGSYIDGFSPRRLEVECEAKQLIIEHCAGITEGTYNDQGPDVASEVLGLLALPYADHPHYRPEWKP